MANISASTLTSGKIDPARLPDIAGAISDGDKGDITVSSSGAVWTIDAGVVTAAKTSITGTPSGSKFLRDDWSWQSVSGTGTVTDFIFTNANGVSGSVSTSTTTPTLTITLGAITPTSVNGNTITTGTGTLTLSTFTLTVSATASIGGTHTGTSSGTNTGDQSTIVGITGTKAQFNTACTDGDFAYTNAANSFSLVQAFSSNGLTLTEAGAEIVTLKYQAGSSGSYVLTFPDTNGVAATTIVATTTSVTTTHFAFASALAGVVSFRAITTADIPNSTITLAKMADVATATVFYRKTAGTGIPEVQTLATLKTDLGLTGTNSGDQTSIAGITGTMAQFDTAVTDGNFVYAARTISTTAPLSGGGDLSADRTLTTSMATNKLIGRGTAGTGVMEEITLGTNLSFAGTTLNATGGGGGNSVTATVDFGSTFTHFAQVVVTGQAWVTANSEVVVTPLAAAGYVEDTTLHQFSCVVSDLVVGVGFTLSVYTPIEAKGTYTFSCMGV